MFMLLGLEMPALVVLALYSSQAATRTWAEPWRTAAILAAATVGFVTGSAVLWWVAVRIYRGKNPSPCSS